MQNFQQLWPDSWKFYSENGKKNKVQLLQKPDKSWKNDEQLCCNSIITVEWTLRNNWH